MKRFKVPVKELHFSFARSSGSGGQNVNKLNTKATLRWNVLKTTALSKAASDRFHKKYINKILSDGTVVLTSQKYRTQARNTADVIEKLHEMIEKILSPPKKRKATKPKRSSIERRLKDKKRQGERKQTRRKEY